MKNLLIIFSFLMILASTTGCSKDEPCTLDRYIGSYSMTSDCTSDEIARIRKGEGMNEIMFFDGKKDLVFVVEGCKAFYQGENFELGFILPHGEMTMDNNSIKVSVTNYLTFIPQTCNFTLR